MANGANGAGDRSEGEDSASSYYSEDRETDADGNYDIDVAERSAWIEEHASQQRLEDPGSDSQDLMLDDSVDGNLMYPPDEDEEPPRDEGRGSREPPQENEGLRSQELPQEDEEVHSQDGIQDASMEAQVHPSTEGPASVQPIPDVVPVVLNGRLSKSRSTSARPRKPADDADLELPPTASTRQNTPEAQSVPAETVADPRHLDAAMSLLNVKSDENLRLEGLLADQRAMLVAERATTIVLKERVKTLESQASVSTGDADLVNRLKAVEELLAQERAAKETALQNIAAVERDRDSARRDQAAAEQQRDVFQEYYLKASQFAEEKGSENKELQKRVTIAEEQTKAGLATIKATFDLREVALKSEIRDWRNQANFLREQAIRTNDNDLRRRAAEHPELVTKYSQLIHQDELNQDRIDLFEHELGIKDDDIARLRQQLDDASEELDRLKAEKLIAGDTPVFRCGWRGEDNVACPSFCLTQEDLNVHASMHVARALADVPHPFAQ
ncbi:hypothetical protein B0H19DRAFT_1156689 [Mycena capillaripes]|nr:hypothetical protein B0H19DRAFT_1156689 [Mycena capillaripes]